MKKIKLNRAFKIDKQVISKLQESQMQKFKGGAKLNDSISCGQLTCNVSCNQGTCNGDKIANTR